MQARKFSDLAREFLAWASKCRKPSTVYVYRHYLTKFLEMIGDVDASAVTPAQLMEFASTWHQCQAVKRMYFWACTEACILSNNPVANVKHPPKGWRRRIMTPAEMQRLIRACKPDLRRLLLGYRETLARPHELRQATWEDLRPDNPSVDLRAALQSGAASIILYEFKQRRARNNTETPRVIILSPRICRLLLRLMGKRRRPTGSIFLTARGRPWSSNALRCRFRRLRLRLKVRRDKRGESIVPYTFRHTGATMAAAAGVRDRLLADVLGHVETTTTSRYQHLQVSHLREAMQEVWK